MSRSVSCAWDVQGNGRVLCASTESHAGVRQLYQEHIECIISMYKITWPKCIIWGHRFPPTLCCGVGEAGASYVNK